jgi:hypothetical protein
MKGGLFFRRYPNGNDRRNFRETWSSFKDKVRQLDEKQKGNDRIQSFIHQIKLGIIRFEEAKAEEAGKEQVNSASLKECLSQTKKYLDTIYWLVYDHEKSQIEELAGELATVKKLLEGRISASELKEEKNESESPLRNSHSGT